MNAVSLAKASVRPGGHVGVFSRLSKITQHTRYHPSSAAAKSQTHFLSVALAIQGQRRNSWRPGTRGRVTFLHRNVDLAVYAQQSTSSSTPFHHRRVGLPGNCGTGRSVSVCAATKGLKQEQDRDHSPSRRMAGILRLIERTLSDREFRVSEGSAVAAARTVTDVLAGAQQIDSAICSLVAADL